MAPVHARERGRYVDRREIGVSEMIGVSETRGEKKSKETS